MQFHGLSCIGIQSIKSCLLGRIDVEELLAGKRMGIAYQYMRFSQ
jgi:hypothetical protein